MPKVTVSVNLDDVQESKPVPGGMYDLTIASCEDGKSQKGLPQLKVSISIDGHDDAPNTTHFVSLPSVGDEKAQAKALFLKRFLTLFKIPYDKDGSFDTDDFAGARAKAELTLSEPDDQGRVYNRLVVPYLDVGEKGGRKAPPPPKR